MSMSYRIVQTLMPAVSILVFLLLLPNAAWAGEEKAVRFDFSMDWTSAYYFRGLLQEDAGTILQPGAEVGIQVMEGEAASLRVVLGAWNSVHSRETGATSSDSFVRDWFEADLYGGMELEFSNWTIGAQYAIYTYPNGAAGSIDELILSVGYDDSSLWRDRFAVNPHMTFAKEIDDREGTEDSYLELGCSPSFRWNMNGGSTLDLTVPLTVGFSVEDYFVDFLGSEDTVGFWELGVDAIYGLPLPARFGGWSINAGVHYLSLSNAAEELNNGDGSAVAGHVGLGWSF